MEMSIRHKPLVALGVGALAMMALVAHLIWTGYRDAIQSAEATTRGYAAILEARLDATLRRADAELREMAHETPVTALTQDAVSRNARLNVVLKSRLIDFPELAGLIIFDVDGDVLYTSNSSGPRPNIADRDYFRTLRDNPRTGSVLSEVIIARTTGRPSVTFARPLRDEQGVFRGVAGALIELEHFQKLFQALDVGAGGVVSIYRSDDFRQVLRWPAIKGTLNVALPPDHPARTALAGANRTATISFAAATDGRVRIYSHHELNPYPFFVAVGVARSEVLAAWRTRSLAVGLSALLLLGLLLGLLHRLGRAEAARTQLAAIVADADVGIYSRTLDGTILTWNAGAEKMLGYSAAAVIGKPVYVTLPPGRPRNLARVNEGLGRGEMMMFESDRLTQDGRAIDVLTSHSPLRDGAGNICGVSVILQDISERKQAQALLKESEERFRATFEQAAVGIAHFDLQNRNLKVNRRYCEIVGYAPEELLGKSPGFLNLPDDLGMGSEQRLQLLSGAIDHFAQDKRYLRKDGKVIWVTRTESLARDAAGAPLYYIRVIEDITERKQQGQKLEKLSRIRAISSEINALIVRSRERRQLLEETCRIAVEHGGFGIAWIGMVDQNSTDVIPAACAGVGAESLMMTSHNSARLDTPLGQGIVGRAIKGKCAVVSNDLATEPGTGGNRRREALRRGYHSIIALPLMVEDNAVGNLSLFAGGVNFFDNEEVALLAELAANVSFALDSIDKAEALADSEKKLDNILGTLHEVVWSIDPRSGRMVYVNAAVRQLARRPVNDFLAHPRLWRRLVHRDDRASMRSAIRRLMQDNTLLYEFRIVLADGEVRTVECSARVRHYNSGKAESIDGTIVDITERVHAEELQRKHYELARLNAALAAAANGAITVEDTFQSSLRLISEHGGWRVGHLAIFTPGIVTKHSAAASLWHVEDPARYAAFIEVSERFDYATGKYLVGKAIAEKIPVWIEDLAVFGDGRRFGIAVAAGLHCAFAVPVVVQSEVAAVLEFYAEDARPPDPLLMENIVNVAAQLARVVERARANEIQTRLAAIVEHASIGIYSRTIEGTILTWNAGAEKMLGYSAADVIGKPIHVTLSPDRPRNLARVNEGVLRGEMTQFESYRLTQDGRVIDVMTSHSPIRDGAGNIVGVSVILQDITERMRAEELQRKHYALARLQAALVKAANEAVTPDAALQTSLRLISDYGGWLLGHLTTYTMNNGHHSVATSLWQVENRARFAALIESPNDFADSMYRQFRHKVLIEKLPVWLENLGAVSLGRRTGIARALGLRSAFAFPLVVQNETAAMLEFYAEDVRAADTLLIENIGQIAAQLARIIERARANEVQARLAGIVENSNDAIIGRSLDGVITSWNAGAERLYGYTAAETVSQPRWRLSPPELLHETDQHRALLAQGLTLPPYKTVRVAKDGRRINVQVTLSPIRDGSGKVVGASSIAHDISENVRAEELQRRHYELSQLLAALAAAANEAVTAETAFQSSLRLISEHGGWRLGHMVVFTAATANQYSTGASLWQVEDRARFAAFMEACERFDYASGKRFVGRAITEKIPVWIEDFAVFGTTRRNKLAVAAGLHCAFAFPVVVQNEVAAVIEFYAEDARPADTLLIENIANITAQLARVIERARAGEAQARLASIVESSQDAIVSSTADGTVLTWNAGAEKMFGYASEETIGKKLLSLIVPDDLRRDIQQRRQGYLSGANFESYESERLTKDRRRLAVSVNASPIKDGAGKVINFATIYRDITERKQAEVSMRGHAMQLRQLSRRLFEVEESERRSLARELHDRVGQNVTALSLNLTMVRGELSGEYRQKLREYLDNCEALLDATGQLIRDVMAELRPPGLDELGLLAALTEHARHIAGLSGFSVTVRGAEEMARLRSATEITLFRIAQEALINVAKHARASAAAIALEADAERVILTVSDNGSGFDVAALFSEAIPHLGMASMRERAESIGGRLSVESARGGGTRVIVEAPRVTRTPRLPPPLSTPTPA
jgi:PAS domain S-box-containing protein